MPTFVIHKLGEEPKKATFDTQQVRIGREPDNDLVLPAKTVSRHHAIVAGRGGRWVARCVSETNPLVVDGAMTRTEVELSDGDEIMLGSDYLAIFVADAHNATRYMGGNKYYVRVVCPQCQWSGMTSSVRANPVCAACGNTALERADAYDKGSASGKSTQDSTSMVDRKQVQAAMQQLKSAKLSRVERVDGKEAGKLKQDLTEDTVLLIGKAANAGLKLTGMSMGGGVEIRWNGQRYVASSSMTFPAMKVNGNKEQVAELNNGDVIEIGSNRFRFVTE